MDNLTVSSALISPASDKPLTPAMLTALWVVGDALDDKRVPAKVTDAVWLDIPSRTFRGESGRSDNVWLRECLERLTGLKIGGDYRGDQWGAVILAEWHIEQGGSMVRVLIPPAAVHAIRSPQTFAKLEADAAYRMNSAARRLYAALADKKRMGKPYWIYTLDEVRRLLDLGDSYPRWADLRRYALLPALTEINDFGTVTVTMTPEKTGRAVSAIRFDWKWKNLDEMRVTDEENQQPKKARHMDKKKNDAPPLTDADREEAERQKQIEADRAAYRAWLAKNPRGTFSQYMNTKPDSPLIEST